MLHLLFFLLATARSSLKPQREFALQNLALGNDLPPEFRINQCVTDCLFAVPPIHMRLRFGQRSVLVRHL